MGQHGEQLKPVSGLESVESLSAEKASIVERAANVKVQAVAVCLRDLRKMINDEKHSDMVFMCRDGVRVYASRLVLAVRSQMLNRMLMNGMIESQLSEINLPDISAAVLLSVMEFLYTGTLMEHAPKSWTGAFEIITAARYFLLQDLEVVLIEYLFNASTNVESDLTAAAKFLSVSVEFNCADDSMDIISRHLVNVLNSRRLSSHNLQALSENAFRYFLRKTVNKHANVKTLSFVEYLRFRRVILWCACRLWPGQGENVLDSLIPDVNTSLELTRNPRLHDSVQVEQPERISARQEELVKYAQSFVSMVELRRIHPELLIKVIEPTNVISPSQMNDALRFHALESSRNPGKQGSEWTLSSKNLALYSVCRDGSVIEKISAGIGCVTYAHAVGCDHRYEGYEWEVVIEEVCDVFIEVGILGGHLTVHDNSFPLDTCDLASQPGGWAFRMDAAGVSINRRGNHSIQLGDPTFVAYGRDFATGVYHNRQATHSIQLGDPTFVAYGRDYSRLIFGKDYGQKNCVIKIHINMYNRACSISLDGQDLGIAWASLPEGKYTPAVSLGSGSNGRARIKLISGFEVLYMNM